LDKIQILQEEEEEEEEEEEDFKLRYC